MALPLFVVCALPVFLHSVAAASLDHHSTSSVVVVDSDGSTHTQPPLDQGNVRLSQTQDADSDGLSDEAEGSGDTDSDSVPDFRDKDSDGDGVPDAVEMGTGNRDHDSDNIPNEKDTDTVDTDGDGFDTECVCLPRCVVQASDNFMSADARLYLDSVSTKQSTNAIH